MTLHEKYLAALGRLPAAKKEDFLSDAESVLRRTAGIKLLSADEAAVLAAIADCANALTRALTRVNRSTLATNYLRNAWRELSGPRGERDNEPFPLDLITTLARLSSAARLWLPEKGPARPAHRPVDYGLPVLAATAIAGQFFRTFGEPPTIGNGSPFVKFCRIAFEMHGLHVPSLAKLREIAVLATLGSKTPAKNRVTGL
ncbi:MAG TPA: hypothetical protein VNW92_24680 [Polyangiaceae bacterium]|nr:hypothetical protein [Polyangiaceae bacterium]